MLTIFSSISMSWVVYLFPNHLYASNISCNRITDLMTCEEQQNGQTSSDGSAVVVDDVDGTSTSNSENDEIPLIIPNISPTLNDNAGADDDEGSDQDNSEDGDDRANREDGNGRASNANGNDDLETIIPSVLPFP
jgi:hypothetical protein